MARPALVYDPLEASDPVLTPWPGNPPSELAFGMAKDVGNYANAPRRGYVSEGNKANSAGSASILIFVFVLFSILHSTEN